MNNLDLKKYVDLLVRKEFTKPKNQINESKIRKIIREELKKAGY